MRFSKTQRVATAAVSLAALAAALPRTSHAQTGQPATEEIVVTGTRIVRDGYQAPTPLTVLDADALAAQTTTSNMAETLNFMPVFSGSLTPNDGAGLPSSGNAGINALNLRNLGTSRTLMLIDGHRVVQTLPNGTVDINTFPQQLVSRVDVVTGGASAVYGSDAVGGVVNFVLDRTYTGIKGEVSGGLTDHGDNPNGRFTLSGGTPFANGRGHALFSTELVWKKGINGTNNRAWNLGGAAIMQNPAYVVVNGVGNGQPEKIVRDDISLANATHGGLVIGCSGPGVPAGAACPLKGVAFGVGGVPYRFNYGPLVLDRYMAGGDWRSTLIREESEALDPAERRMNAFLRVSYDLSDNVSIFGESSWNDSKFNSVVSVQYEPGNGPTILSGNAFLPAEIQAQMTAFGVTSLRMGSMNMGMPKQTNNVERVSQRNLIGLEGNFDAGGTEWSWDAYAQISVTRSSQTIFDVVNTTNYPKALDAVRDPATGTIVCRVTLQTGERCVPWNYLGIGVNGIEAVDYLFGDPHVNQRPLQKVAAASITGAPFSTWAGPVSVALSAEWREETGRNVPSAESAGNNFRAGNYQPFYGKYSVKEAAVETVVPLLGEGSDMVWDLNVAARATDYSVSGYVTTWKLGTTFAPIPDVRFRATRSRDIRAPTLEDLFANNLLGFGSAFDPFTNTTPQFFRRILGNQNLKPEKADTLNLGAVLQPSFVPGLSFSVDYWKINLKDGINNLGDQNAITLCFQNVQQFCSLIQRTNGAITFMTSSPQNFSTQRVAGIDFEASYRMPLSDLVASWPGELGFHGNATKNITNYTNPGIGITTQSVGQNGGNGAPYWRFSATFDYAYEGLKTSLTARAFSDGVQDPNWIECSTGCPTSTAQSRTIDNNHIEGAWYLDGSIAYEFDVGGTTLETFLNVRNLLGTDPVIIPGDSAGFAYISMLTNPAKYEPYGRVFRAGVRFRM
jgi:iron complex outermembrane recepter protein